MNDAELAPSTARPPTFTLPAGTHGSIRGHESLKQCEALSNRSVQVALRDVLISQDADLTEFRLQRYWPALRPLVKPPIAALDLVMVLAQASCQDVSTGGAA